MDNNIKVMLNNFNNSVFDLLNYIVFQENKKDILDSKLELSDFN